jgi:hypothetical protein
MEGEIMNISYSMGNELVNFGAYSEDNFRAQFSYDPTFPVNSDRYGMMTWWESCYVKGSNRSWFINSSNELVLVIPQESLKNWAVA